MLLSEACVDNRLRLMEMPPDLDRALRKFIAAFGAAGNSVDLTGGEPPATYHNTIELGLQDPRIHALILGYWHTIITPPMVFARLVAEVVEEYRGKGIDQPVVASLVGDVEVEQACRHLFEHNIPAYPYTTEKPVAVLGAKGTRPHDYRSGSLPFYKGRARVEMFKSLRYPLLQRENHWGRACVWR